MTADNEVGDDGGGGVSGTTNRQTRDEGRNEEGKDSKDKRGPVLLSLKKNNNQPLTLTVAMER